jgi:stage V sporulation protein AE
MDKRKVVFVTDGDEIAKGAIETATSKIGGRCISASAGNPTALRGEQILELIKKAKHDPVVVMVDDRSAEGIGRGEKVMDFILKNDEIDVLGVVAVSTNGMNCQGLKTTCSITKNGKIIEGAVNKMGNEIEGNEICGDTLSVLSNVKNLIVVGIGDPGKMDYIDEAKNGSPITTMALNEVLRRSGYRS